MTIYNNPAIGQGFANLAAAFAPPSGSDLAGYATARAKKEEAARLADLFRYAQAEGFDQSMFDRMGAAAGQWNPSQGYYAVDEANATTRRGQDVAAQASITNNQNTVRGGLLSDLYAPLNPGQVRPALPEAIASQFDLPAIGAEQGLPKPLSESEWAAAQNQRMLDSGALTDQMLIDNILGEETPVQAIGPDGRPIYMSPGAAVRTGAPVHDRTAASTDADNYLAIGPQGEEVRFVGYVGPDGKIYDRATGEAVPNVVRREGTGGGMSLEVGKDGQISFSTGGGNTISRTTSLQSQINENDRGAQELISLFDNLRQDDLGLLGSFNEGVLTNFGGQVNPELARPDVVARRNQLRASTANLAKAIMNDERLSDTDRRFAREISVSDGIDVSLPGAQAQIAQLAVLLRWQEAAARAQLAGEPAPVRDRAFIGRLVDEGKLPAYVARQYIETMAVPRGTSGSAGQPVPEQNGQPNAEDIPVVSTMEEARALPSGSRFRAPDGSIRVVP